MSRLMRAAAIGLALATVLLGACSKDDDLDENPRSTEETAVDADTVTATSDAPRTSGFTPARDDVTALSCTRDGDSWKIVGTVENPTDEPADYRIYPLLLDGADALQGIAQADVDGVGAGQAAEWTASIDLPLEDLHCGVRVERTPAD